MERPEDIAIGFLLGTETQKAYADSLGMGVSHLRRTVRSAMQSALSPYIGIDGHINLRGLPEDIRWSLNMSEGRKHADIIVPLLRGEAPAIKHDVYEYCVRRALPFGVGRSYVFAENGESPTALGKELKLELINKMGRSGWRFVSSRDLDEQVFFWEEIEDKPGKVRKAFYGMEECLFERVQHHAP